MQIGKSGRVTDNESASTSQQIRNEGTDVDQGRGLRRSVSPFDQSSLLPQGSEHTIHTIPNELLTKIISHTRLNDRYALQLTCHRFRETGNTLGIIERQAVNTYRGSTLSQGSGIADHDQALIAMLSRKTGMKMLNLPHPGHLRLAGYLKMAPYRYLKTLAGPGGHTGRIWSMTFLGNGQLASCSADKTIKIWDVDTGQCLNTLGISENSQSVATSMAHLGNGLLAYGTGDGAIKIWGYGDTSLHEASTSTHT